MHCGRYSLKVVDATRKGFHIFSLNIKYLCVYTTKRRSDILLDLAHEFPLCVTIKHKEKQYHIFMITCTGNTKQQDVAGTLWKIKRFARRMHRYLFRFVLISLNVWSYIVCVICWFILKSPEKESVKKLMRWDLICGRQIQLLQLDNKYNWQDLRECETCI